LTAHRLPVTAAAVVAYSTLLCPTDEDIEQER